MINSQLEVEVRVTYYNPVTNERNESYFALTNEQTMDSAWSVLVHQMCKKLSARAVLAADDMERVQIAAK